MPGTPPWSTWTPAAGHRTAATPPRCRRTAWTGSGSWCTSTRTRRCSAWSGSTTGTSPARPSRASSAATTSPAARPATDAYRRSRHEGVPVIPKPARRHAARPAGRTATDIFGGLFALLALLTLVVALPLALAWLTPKLVTLPDHVPDLRELRAALLRRDDGQHLALAIIAGIGWVGWLWFAVSVVVETVAQVRGLPAPRVRGFGGGQRLAASLVTSAAVLLSSGSPALAVAGSAAPMPAAPWFQVPVAALSTAPAHAPAPGQVTVSVPAPMAAPVAEHVAAPAPAVPPAAAPPPAPAAPPAPPPAAADTVETQQIPAAAGGPPAAPDHPVYQVARGDNLWNIARLHLGDP